MLTVRSPRYLGTIQDNNRHQQTPRDSPKHPKRQFEDVWLFRLTLNGICWCVLLSFGVWRRRRSVLWCLEMRGGCLRSYSKDIWVLFMNVIKVWVPPREYLSVQALYDAANALYWKISERQNSTQLAFLKHQNTKTSLCELSKNHWVIAPFYISGPIKRKLQSTVSLDHPVTLCNTQWHSFTLCNTL